VGNPFPHRGVVVSEAAKLQLDDDLRPVLGFEIERVEMERFQRRSVSILNTVSDENLVIWLEAPPFATGLHFMRETFKIKRRRHWPPAGRPLAGRSPRGKEALAGKNEIEIFPC
jgi:hypothetical protein